MRLDLSLKAWWPRKSGQAKLVTALTTLLILQIGTCFASPGEPVWFDKLFSRFNRVLINFAQDSS